MKKIILGVMSITLVVAMVSGAAYALFSSQATVSGITVTAGNAGLVIRGANEATFTSNWNFPFVINGLRPGYGDSSLNDVNGIDMYLKNESSSPIALGVTMKFTTLPTGWGNYLTYSTQMLIKDEVSGTNTGWKSLDQWGAGEVSLPGASIANGATRRYFVFLRVPLTYGEADGAYTGGPSTGTVVGNEIAGQNLTGSVITLTGTQVNP